MSARALADANDGLLSDCAFNGKGACDHYLNATLNTHVANGALENNGTLVMEVMDELRMAGIVGRGSNESKSRTYNACTNTTCIDGLFRTWAEKKQLAASDMGCGSWPDCHYNSSVSLSFTEAKRFYYSTVFEYDTSIWAYKQYTDAVLRRIPKGLVGANFSPDHNHGSPVFQYIRAFREGAFTLPWVSLHDIVGVWVTFLVLWLTKARTGRRLDMVIVHAQSTVLTADFAKNKKGFGCFVSGKFRSARRS